MKEISISLDDRLSAEVAEMALDEGVSVDELVRQLVRRCVRSRHGPSIPQFARRLGPLAFAEDDRQDQT